MRTTITIDDSLLEKAKGYSGVTKISELLEVSLKSYISTQASTRLGDLGGSDPFAEVAPRREASPTDGDSLVMDGSLDEQS